MLDGRLEVVVTLPRAGGAQRGLVRELVLDAAEEGHRLVHDALEVLAPAVEELERVVDALFENLVASSSEKASGHVKTGPVEGVLAACWLVD